MSECIAKAQEFTVMAESGIVHILDAEQVIRLSMYSDEWHELFVSYSEYMSRGPV